MIWKKLAAYLAIIVILLAVSFYWHGVRVAREVARQTAAASEERRNSPSAEIVRALSLRLQLDAVKDLVEAGRDELIYRAHERTYRRLLANLSYNKTGLEQAVEKVEREKATIIREAVGKFLDEDTPEDFKGNAERSRIWRVQKLLRVQGIYLGGPTARLDPDTAYAIKTWQIQRGEARTGRVDAKLVEALTDHYIRRRMGIKVGLSSGATSHAPARPGAQIRG